MYVPTIHPASSWYPYEVQQKKKTAFAVFPTGGSQATQQTVAESVS